MAWEQGYTFLCLQTSSALSQVCNGDDYVRIKVADFQEIIRLVKLGSLTGSVAYAESSITPDGCSETSVTAETYQVTQFITDNEQNLIQQADIKNWKMEVLVKQPQEQDRWKTRHQQCPHLMMHTWETKVSKRHSYLLDL